MLFVAMCGGSISAEPSVATVKNSVFEITPDGASVEVRDISRREVMERLFAETGIELKWISAASAKELITGKFSGTRADIARQLLSQTNFVIGYDDKSRLARLIIVGPATRDQSSAALTALTTAMQDRKSVV